MKSLQIFCIRSHKERRVCLLLLLLVITASVGSLCVGAVMVSPMELFLAEPSSATGRILRYSRIPRTCSSLLAGAALATAGAVIQSVLSNPLAAPNIIGVNAGAGCMAALCCAFLPGYVYLTPIAAFFGALLGVFLTVGVSEFTGASKVALVLSGVAISSLFSAATDAVVTFVPDALAGYTDFRIGGFRGVTMERLVPAAVMIGIALVLCLCMSRSLEIMTLGRDTAQSLGVRVKIVRVLLLTFAAALAGAAVSFCGLLGFVGLLVPHIVRKLVGSHIPALMLGSALGGAFLVTFCDTIARSLFSPFEVPVGIVLSFLGAPFFLWLLIKQKKGRLHD